MFSDVFIRPLTISVISGSDAVPITGSLPEITRTSGGNDIGFEQ